MNYNNEVIIKFYQAFQQLDWKTMQQFYHADARFTDPVFPDLNSRETQAMWHMLCKNAQGFSLKYSDIESAETTGKCRWDAWYTFSKTGRKVHNIIHANFLFKDGLILKHIDSFNFWRWSQMSLGLTGVLLGWTPYVQKKVQATARKSLNKFILEHY